ncbi:MAG: hypothetical protein AB7N71_07235 [Phycisphaerae bacterium]
MPCIPLRTFPLDWIATVEFGPRRATGATGLNPFKQFKYGPTGAFAEAKVDWQWNAISADKLVDFSLFYAEKISHMLGVQHQSTEREKLLHGRSKNDFVFDRRLGTTKILGT